MAAYATIAEANTYFAERLHTAPWDEALTSDKNKALAMATKQIDCLDFALSKTVAAQANEFPRGTETTIPDDIKNASCEIAISLLDGDLPDDMLADMSVKQDVFANVRTTYDRANTPEHIIAGIVSATAWRILRPYLEEPGNIKLSRVS